MASALINKLVEQGKTIGFVVDRLELVTQSYDTFDKKNVSIVKAGYDKDFDADKPIQIIMIQTFFSRKDKLPDLDLDYILIDEVHNNWNTGRINELLKIYSDAKVVGLTATPCDSKGWLLQGFDGYVEGLQARELIKLGRLCPTKDYIFESYGLNLDAVSIINGDYSVKEVDEQVLDLNKVSMIVDEWERLGKGRKTLVFSNSIKHATMLWREFVRRGHKFELLHSKNNNRSAIDKIKNDEIDGIVNVSITIAGFDCPYISCIVNARVTCIEKVARQLLGRGRRVCKGKVDNIHLDFANCVSNFGWTDDDRYYVARPPKNDEPLFQQCPECGNIEPIHVKQCSICGYDLSIVIEKGKGTSKQTKKQLEQLIRTYSLQDEVYNKIRELVKERGHKAGYAWHLFRMMLERKQAGSSMLQFYKTRLTKIERIRKNGWKLGSLVYR